MEGARGNAVLMPLRPPKSHMTLPGIETRVLTMGSLRLARLEFCATLALLAAVNVKATLSWDMTLRTLGAKFQYLFST